MAEMSHSLRECSWFNQKGNFQNDNMEKSRGSVHPHKDQEKNVYWRCHTITNCQLYSSLTICNPSHRDYSKEKLGDWMDSQKSTDSLIGLGGMRMRAAKEDGEKQIKEQLDTRPGNPLEGGNRSTVSIRRLSVLWWCLRPLWLWPLMTGPVQALTMLGAWGGCGPIDSKSSSKKPSIQVKIWPVYSNVIPSYFLSYTSLFWICKHGKCLFNKSLQSHTQSSHAVIVHSYRRGQESKKPYAY